MTRKEMKTTDIISAILEETDPAALGLILNTVACQIRFHVGADHYPTVSKKLADAHAIALRRILSSGGR